MENRIHLSAKEQCSGCMACVLSCPQSCIGIARDTDGFSYPRIHTRQCVSCGKCKSVCRYYSEEEKENKFDMYAAACWHLSPDIRRSSSSGGVFYAVAEAVLGDGGVVFGAAYDENFNIVHKHVDTVKELCRLQGSKYVQSDIQNTYKQAHDFLAEGRRVLFSGTPCQIYGLKRFLNHDDPNLICADLICQGVGSPLSWKLYKREREEIRRGKVKAAKFRDKESGWTNFSMKMRFSNGNTYTASKDKDDYLKAFLNFLNLRPSCYHCLFRGINNTWSDFTMGDFWGVREVNPKLYDEQGVSFVLVHTEKGDRILREARLERRRVAVNPSIQRNLTIVRSVKRPKNRELFMKLIKKYRFSAVARLMTGRKK